MNLDAEKALLAACMLDEDAYVTACEYVSPQSFYHMKHQKIFQAMMELDEDNEPIDLVTLTEKTNQAAYLSELSDYLPTSANAEHYAKSVAESYHRQQTKRILTRALSDVEKEKDIDSVIAAVDRKLANVLESSAKEGLLHIKQAADERMDEYEKMQREGGVTGISTGFPEVDETIGGFEREEMTVLAARPGVGKSAFAINVALKTAAAGNNVAFFSLEMSRKVVIDRMMGVTSRLNVRKLRVGQVGDWVQAVDGMSKISSLPIWINDDRNITTTQIRAQCRRLHKREGVDLVIVDYSDWLADKRERGESIPRYIGQMCRRLRGMLSDFNGSLLLLHQLNRESEKENRRPRLSDLRESGHVEQDADVVWFLHPDGEDKDGWTPIELLVRKNRNGPTGIIKLVFDGAHTKFEERERRRA